VSSIGRLLDPVLSRTLFVPVAAVRPYLVLKCTLLLLSFDMWLTRIEHGGRYGAGGFNVAHFAWLDAIQPDVTAGLYVGVCVLTGMLCFGLALAPKPPRWLIAVAFLLHTWSWAMSQLDSYQHHYLLSIVLLALVFFPQLRAEEALIGERAEREPKPEPAPAQAPARKGKKGKKGKAERRSEPKRSEKRSEPQRDLFVWLLEPAPKRSAWAYVVLSVSMGIVYAYTAYSKTADEWLSGAAFKRVLSLRADGTAPDRVVDHIAPLRELAAAFGIEGDTFWWTMGHSVVLVQIVCCAGYLLAPFLDVSRNALLKTFVAVSMLTALSFHFGAEYMELKIGWFSWYMIGYALVFMLPAGLVAALARVIVPIPGAPFEGTLLVVRLILGPFLLVLGLLWKPFFAIGGGIAISTLITHVNAVRGVSGLVLPVRVVGVALVGALAVGWSGYAIDLPGAPEAAMACAVLLAVGTVLFLLKVAGARTIHAYGTAALLGAFAFLVAVITSPVRFDFYRNVGGDHRRRGDLVTAYVAYVKANRYAPEGEGRQDNERELRRQLEQQGRLPQVDE
jgi:hypothetical protein